MQPFAGFWIRLVAYIIDSVILNIVSFIVGGVFGLGLGASGAMTGTQDGSITTAFLGGGIGLLISWLYFALTESSSWQGTPGKKALGLVVTDERGERISFMRATGRFFAKILSAIILLIGFIMVGLTQRKQGLHDKLAGTLVYKGAARDVTSSPAVFE